MQKVFPNFWLTYCFLITGIPNFQWCLISSQTPPSSSIRQLMCKEQYILQAARHHCWWAPNSRVQVMTVSISFSQSKTKLFGNDWCDNWLSGANWTCLETVHTQPPHPTPLPPSSPPSTVISCPGGCKLTHELRLLAKLHVVCSRTVFSSPPWQPAWQIASPQARTWVSQCQSLAPC